MNYPEHIESLSLALAAKSRELQDLRAQLDLKESAATLEILNARDEQGKALYSNETARNAALKLALSANPRYQELERKVAVAEQERAELFANLERVRGEFKVYLLDREQEIAAMRAE